MSHFKAKMHQILFPASDRSFARPFVFDTVDESHRRRQGVTTQQSWWTLGALRPCVSQ